MTGNNDVRKGALTTAGPGSCFHRVSVRIVAIGEELGFAEVERVIMTGSTDSGNESMLGNSVLVKGDEVRLLNNKQLGIDSIVVMTVKLNVGKYKEEGVLWVCSHVHCSNSQTERVVPFAVSKEVDVDVRRAMSEVKDVVLAWEKIDPEKVDKRARRMARGISVAFNDRDIFLIRSATRRFKTRVAELGELKRIGEALGKALKAKKQQKLEGHDRDDSSRR